MSFRLSELRVGTQAILDKYSISPLHKKLLSMGLVPGQKISVMRKLPMHGNLYVRIDGRHVAFRYEEAEQILVKV